MMSNTKLMPLCAECGKATVNFEAHATWDTGLQTYTLGDILDREKGWCNDPDCSDEAVFVTWNEVRH